MSIFDKIIDNISFGSFAGLYNCGNDNLLRLYSDVSEDEFNAFISEIRTCGSSKKQDSFVDNFISLTFYADNCFFVISYDKKSYEMRIILDSASRDLNIEKKTAGKCPVRLWQFEVDHSLIDCGMCYIVQLSDYSFFVVDSAHTYSVNDDKRIYELLRKETPDELPVRVAGWFLSHGHVDHIAKFFDILKYNHDIIIDGLYFNFVPNDHLSSDSWMYSDKMHTELFLREVEKRTDIPVYKLHSGQYFYLDSVRFDVLCTHEDVFPASLDNYNDSSTVLIMTVENDKVCFPGDAGGEVSKILERRFPDYLNCNIIQVAHHGHFGTTSDFYRMCDADVALFATTQIKFDEEFEHYEANRVAYDIAKHTFIASNGTVCFTFPLNDSEIIIYKDETIESFDGVYNLWGYEYSDERKEELIDKYLNSCVCKIKY